MVGFLSKALIIQIKKNEIHEQWIIGLQNKVEKTYQTITMLDDRQMFAKDDEVGTVFQQIVEIVKSLNEITTKE
jgi:hypothetical protein